jgi:RimJ/RimL family protein N-acetyltransferase
MTPLHLRRAVSVGPLRPEYAPHMYRWMCDPVVSENLGLRSTPTLEKTSQWIEHSLHDESLHPFAVLLDSPQADSQPIEKLHVGNVIIDRIDTYLAMGRLSIYIGETSARGAGVGLTGMYLALQASFSELNLHKIWLTVHTRNFPAINTYNKLGFALEGVLRDEFWLNGARLSALYMGLLRPDFERLTVEWS